MFLEAWYFDGVRVTMYVLYAEYLLRHVLMKKCKPGNCILCIISVPCCAVIQQQHRPGNKTYISAMFYMNLVALSESRGRGGKKGMGATWRFAPPRVRARLRPHFGMSQKREIKKFH